jgi:chitin deacetylase
MYKVLLAALLAVAAATASARPSEDFTVKFTRRQNGNYPPALQTPPQSSLPQAWIDALNAATAAGKIPNVPVSTLVNGNPTYPNNVGTNTDTCNWTLSKCLGAKDISSVPNNEWTISFDDGPTQASPALYDYLHSHSQAGTHFMVSSAPFWEKKRAAHSD